MRSLKPERQTAAALAATSSGRRRRKLMVSLMSKQNAVAEAILERLFTACADEMGEAVLVPVPVAGVPEGLGVEQLLLVEEGNPTRHHGYPPIPAVRGIWFAAVVGVCYAPE